MRAAIYCRKSTQQEGTAVEEKSVATQERACREYIATQGWTVADGHVYIDDAASGALFTQEGRPGFFALVDAAKSTAHPFDVIVVTHEDRFGRDAVRVAYVLKQLNEHDVRIYSVAGGERRLDTATDLLLLNITAFAGEFEREQATTRVRAKFADKVQRAQHVGGKVYGYRIVQKDGHVDLEIDEAQAEVVRRIFELHVKELGIKRISSLLNDEGVPAPGSKRTTTDAAGQRNTRTSDKWSATGIRDLLRNERYAGRVIYGRTRRAMKRGGKVRLNVGDSSKWLTVEREDLRVVPEGLWQANAKRVAATAAQYLRKADGTVEGRPAQLGAATGKYLLSGLLACGECGGNLIAVKRRSSNKKIHVYYICATYRVRGPKACSNARGLQAGDIESMVTTGFKRFVLTPDAVETVLTDAAKDRAEGPQLAAQRATFLAQLIKIEGELGNLIAALAGGAGLESVKASITQREAERNALLARLEHVDGQLKAAAAWEAGSLAGSLKVALADWSGLLEQSPEAARSIIKRLFATPFSPGRREGLGVQRHPDLRAGHQRARGEPW
jgi:DNA invertase Pin-like site-specific DNA recombinase